MYTKIIILLILLALASCAKQELADGNATLKIRTIGNTTVEIFDKVGMTLFAMLEKNHLIKANYGQFLECIDNVCSNREFAWAIYVDGKQINYGIKSYIVKDS